MARMTVLAILVSLWLTAPAAAQASGWTSYQQDEACIAEYTFDNRTTRLTRRGNGSQELAYFFRREGFLETRDLKAEIKQRYYPEHSISVSSRTTEETDFFGTTYESEIAFRIEASEALLNWMEQDDPAYAVRHKGNVIAAFAFLGIGEGRRVLAGCVIAPRPANRAPMPQGARANWFEIDRLQPHLSGVSGAVRVAADLTVDTNGRVQSCSVTASTGSSAADQELCSQLTNRGRFRPATDSRGELASAIYEYRVTLQLN